MVLSDSRALETAQAMLNTFSVCPRENDQASLTPAAASTLRTTGLAAMPKPRGAGFSVTSTEPFLPMTLMGSEWRVLQPHSQEPQPKGTETMLRLAFLAAASMAGRTSSDLPA